jgi:hypothetical protein
MGRQQILISCNIESSKGSTSRIQDSNVSDFQKITNNKMLSKQ